MSHSKKKRCFFLIIAIGVIGIGLLMTIMIVSSNLEIKPTDNQVIIQDFEWLRGRNFLHIFVQPEKTTAEIVPTSISSYDERNFVACFVFSSPKNFLKRKAIRATWGEQIKPLFLIAQSDRTSMEKVSVEAETYDDIIVEDFIDSHDNLTLKTAFALKNFLNHFSSSTYFLKIDDDMYMNVTKFHAMLTQAPIDSLIGRLNLHAKPLRNQTSKFYVPEFLFDPVEYPPYLEGPAYVIPGHLVKSIYDTAMKTPFFNMEDVFYTGMIARQILNFKLHHDPHFRVLPFAHNLPCLYEDYIVVHEISSSNLINLWKRFEKNKKCKFLEKIEARAFFEKEWSQASNQSKMFSLHSHTVDLPLT